MQFVQDDHGVWFSRSGHLDSGGFSFSWRIRITPDGDFLVAHDAHPGAEQRMDTYRAAVLAAERGEAILAARESTTDPLRLILRIVADCDELQLRDLLLGLVSVRAAISTRLRNSERRQYGSLPTAEEKDAMAREVSYE